MAGTSARYDGGAGAPHDQQALALQPPPAAANGARQAPIARKRPIELEAQNGRLLGVVPRTGTTTALPQRDVTRLLQALMLPALPSAKRRPADAPTGDDPGAAERPHQSPVQSRAIMLKPTARQPPVIQITYGPPQDDLAERLQRMLQQALAQGLGPPMPRRPAVVARAIGTHPPPCTARSIRAIGQGRARPRHHYASNGRRSQDHLVAMERSPLDGRLAALGSADPATLSVSEPTSLSKLASAYLTPPSLSELSEPI